KGSLNLIGRAQAVAGELLSIPDFSESEDSTFAEQKKVLSNLKKAGLLVAGAAVQKLMMTLAKEQEILMQIADIIGYVYVAESVLLRAEKFQEMGDEKAVYAKVMADIYMYTTVDKVSVAAKEALNSFGEGDELNMMLMGLRRFTKTKPINIKEVIQKIAKELIEQNKYCFYVMDNVLVYSFKQHVVVCIILHPALLTQYFVVDIRKD